ncbi:uncharacterized protein LOC113295604 [Papaver somniferum]|uniref:uncharacterized protein LOC113295604 n=1 Tax=Papaver somniferum TaxID=3469 RepID=UPI000E6FC334|nr:uncharacterized protein LOC113295604 [Papaver somniferum]
MRVLYWNINGVAREAAQTKLTDLVRDFKPEIFCISEPKVACSTKFRRVLQNAGYSPDVIHNASFSGIANIWICYVDGITPMVVNRSKQDIEVAVDGVHISFVRASYVQVTRRRLWQQLDMQDSVTPWLVMGDFNCVLRLDEKKGGLEPRTSVINEFSDWMDDNDLFEADSLGTKFTWSNRQSGSSRIISKLDRAVINSACWNAPAHGSPYFIFPYKMKRLKVTMKDWNLRIFGNIYSRLKQDQLRFETAARNSDEDPGNITKLNVMKDAMEILSETRSHQVTLLKQKSRNQWLVDGSSNTSFFHNSIRIRRSNNTISELVGSSGTTITDYDQLRNNVVQFYEDIFNGQELEFDEDLFNFEHPSITMEESCDMGRIPSSEEIKQAALELDSDSAPGPDGFSDCFYRHCWDIIQDDLTKAIIYCWNTGPIPNDVNSSLIILRAKVRGANTLPNFGPIGLSNFLFKIFTKILGTRLSRVLDKLVFEEQVAFMKVRNIHENISLASEMVDELHIKRKDGNIGLKLDISQAFDTVSWSFFLEVFRRYGYSERWCAWLFDILNSARIFILLNGNPEGYFKINRGLRQVDPLSPLIFVLIGDVLSRNISKLFRDKKISPMVTRNGYSPTHLFFADDIMIFCKGNLKSVHNLVELLGKYQVASGQTVCRHKSKIYYGGGSLSRRTFLADLLVMSVATYPDRYLGVQIMPGMVRYHHISNVIEKIKAQLAGWKGRLLSFHDRIVLVKSVIASYSLHNMAEGGLGLTRMSTMNKALLMKLWWKIRNSKKKWAGFIRSKFFGRIGCIKTCGVKSTILPGIRCVYKIVENNTKVLLGDGRSTSLYFDIWCTDICLADILNDSSLDRNIMVSDHWFVDHWTFIDAQLDHFIAAGVNIDQLPTPQGGEDNRIWMPDLKGVFSVSSAKELVRQKYPILEGTSLIWKTEVHPVLAAQRGVCATYELIKSRFKIPLANKCCMCGNVEETLDHVLFSCSFAARAWSWLSQIFGVTPDNNLVTSYKATKGRSQMVRDLWLLANLVIKSELWDVRNMGIFERNKPNWNMFF